MAHEAVQWLATGYQPVMTFALICSHIALATLLYAAARARAAARNARRQLTPAHS